MRQRFRLCRFADLKDNKSRGFDPDGKGQDRLFVVRRGETAFVYLDQCPHEGSHMAWRRHEYLNAARDRIVCNAHGAQFEVETGLCVVGPCLGKRLRPIDHRVDERGDLVIELGDAAQTS